MTAIISRLTISAIIKHDNIKINKRERIILVNSFLVAPMFNFLKIMAATNKNDSNWTKSRIKNLI
jgi:hypothetical protein